MLRRSMVFLLIALLVVTTVAPSLIGKEVHGADVYDTLRLKWLDFCTGGDYDPQDPDVVEGFTKLNEEVLELWGSMDTAVDRSYLWSDLADGENDSTPMGLSYSRLKKMSKAYAYEGTNYYGDQNLKNDIIEALDWLYINWYNTTEPKDGNWWHWEIGAPKSLTEMTIIFYDDLTPDKISDYMATVRHFVDVTKFTSANRVDVCKIAILEGIVIKDGSRIQAGVDGLEDVYGYVTSGNGFYTDGSYIDHSNVPYTYSYGSVLLTGIAHMFYLLAGSDWEISSPGSDSVYQWIYDSFESTMYKLHAFDSLRGRAISREEQTDMNLATGALGNIALFAESADPTDEYNFKSLIKHMLTSNDQYDDTKVTLFNQGMFDTILNDSSILPRGEITSHTEFNNMDRSVHMTEDYAFVVSKSSKRVRTYELINGENTKGWYTGHGMTYLYNDDHDAYMDDFWATVNYYRLPGTTVDTGTRYSNDFQIGDGEGAPANSWSGGVTLNDIYGVSGMNLQDYTTTLSANKSWFMFDNEVVALGSDINSTDSRTIETIVEQRKLNEAGDNLLTVDGSLQSSGLGWETSKTGVSWVHLAGTSGVGADVGYYFPGTSDLNFTRMTQSGKWSDINGYEETDTRTKNFLSMWFDHGTNPVNESYSYVLLPGKTASEVGDYVTNPDIEIIANNQNVHCVKEKTLNVTGANFWSDIETTAGIITSDSKASVMMKEITDDTLKIAVNDPTMENSGSIRIEIAKDAPGGVLSADPEITVVQSSPTIILSVNVNGAKGKSFEAEMNIDPAAEPVTPSWDSSANFDAIYDLGASNVGRVTMEFDVKATDGFIDGVMGYSGTGVTIDGYSDMPVIVRMNTNGEFDVRNGTTYMSDATLTYSQDTVYHVRIDVDINSSLYDVFITPIGEETVQIASSYAFRSDAPTVSDLAQLCLKDQGDGTPDLKVYNHVVAVDPYETGREFTFNASGDSYVRDADYSDVNYGDRQYMTVKSGATAYSRKAYAMFDLTTYDGAAVESALLRFYVKSVNTDPTRTVTIYGTDTGWDEHTITWNSTPANLTAVGTVEVTGTGWYELDITDHISSTIGNGQTSVAFINEAGASAKNDFTMSTKEDGTPVQIIITEEGGTVQCESVGDTFVRGGIYSSDNYGANGSMVVKASTNDEFTRKAFVQYDFGGFTGSNIRKATLRFNVSWLNTDPTRTITVYGTETGWDEMIVNWNNSPVITTNSLATVEVTGTGWYEVDVTDFARNCMADRKLSLIIVNEGTASSKNDFSIKTKEGGDGTQLIIE